MIRQDPYRDLGRDCSAKLVERSGSEQRALLDQPVPGADILGIPELVSAEKDSDIFLQSEIPDQPVHVLGTFGIQSGSGLIEKKDFGPMDQGTGKGKPLPHTRGVGAEPAIRSFFQTELAEKSKSSALGTVPIQSEKRSVEKKIFQSGEIIIHLSVFTEPA